MNYWCEVDKVVFSFGTPVDVSNICGAEVNRTDKCSRLVRNVTCSWLLSTCSLLRRMCFRINISVWFLLKRIDNDETCDKKCGIVHPRSVYTNICQHQPGGKNDMQWQTDRVIKTLVKCCPCSSSIVDRFNILFENLHKFSDNFIVTLIIQQHVCFRIN